MAGSLFAAKVDGIAPGVWRIRFGQPEDFTPTHFRSAAMNKAALKKMPPAAMPLAPDKLAFEASSRGCSLLVPMIPNEHIYGFGLSTKLFDMTENNGHPTGRHIFLKPTDSPENELGESHAPVPFYVSSQGYGLFIDTARFSSVYTGDVAALGGPRGRKLLFDVPAAKGLDVYVFAGPAMIDAVERYNLFSGGGPVPPLWGLGAQYRGYSKYGADDTLNLAARLRADHIPCDVWGVEPGWQSKSYSCSFVWNSNAFPDPDGFLAKMRAMNFRMNFWEHAFTHPTSPIYTELKAWSGNYLVWGGLVPDFATAKGRKIFLKQNRVALFNRQVEAVKLDECDYQPESPTPWSFPPASAFPSGLDGEQMHSLFGELYQQTLRKPYQEKQLRTWGLVRNSQALAAPLPYVLYSDSYDHRCYVRGLCNEGFSGLLWTPEVRDASSIEDLYRRLETVIFSPDAVINSWYIPNPPWYQVNRQKNAANDFMPERAAATEGVRKLLQLRMEFVPYLYSAFNEYHSSGKPPIRALVLDWPKDAATREIDDEFMFGDSVLVAPIFAGETARNVYLPAGNWHDFWTRAKIAGGKTIQANNGSEQIPLYIKDGTLLPLADPVEFIKPDTAFNVTVNVVGDNPADFKLYEDDGATTDYAEGAQNEVHLHAEDRSVSRTGGYHGPSRYNITGWKQF